MANKLPSKMRTKESSSGKIFYYYDTCQTPRKWIPLGDVFADAARKYADLEGNKTTPYIITFKYVADKYMTDVVPKKSIATQHDNLREIKKLLEFFDDPPAPIDEIKPIHIRQYLDWRVQNGKGYVRANREKALFSHMWNKAREWGFTEKGNPCLGIKGFKETGRDVYVTDEEYQALWSASVVPLRNALDLAYLTGQRPADVLKMNAEDIVMDELHVRHNKTKTKLRISIQGKLKTLISNLPKEGRLLRNEKGEALTYSMLRSLFETARKQSEVTFQFRDLRAKAGTDKEDLEGMGAAKDQLGHSSEAMTSHYVRHRLGKKVTPTK